MSYFEELNAEIAAKIEALNATGQPLVAAWITHAICNDHIDGLAENEQREFWLHGGHKTVRAEVRRHISKKFGDDIEVRESHPTLPGFDHLRTQYFVKREDDDLVVAVHDLTDEEIDGKAALYRSMGAACFAHADELERFKHLRTPSMAAAE
jgi:hypothetical protein